MKKLLGLFVTSLALPCWAFERPAPSYNYFELGYSFIDIDDSSDLDMDGLRYDLSFSLGDRFYLRGSRWEVENEAVVKQNITRKDFALGYHYDFSDFHTVYVEGARGKYDEVFYGATGHFFVKTKNVAVGYRVRPMEQLEAGIRVNYEKFEYDFIPDENETETTIDVIYYPLEKLGIVGQWQSFFDEDIWSVKARFDF